MNMDELLVIDKILDFLVPVKLRGKRMGILMERGVKLMFLCVVTLVSAEIILRKTIDAIGEETQTNGHMPSDIWSCIPLLLL